MADWNAVTAFMAAVVPWPVSPQDTGYVNLHYSMLNPKPTAAKPLIKGMGWPFRKTDELVSRASWINTTNNFKDVWFCTSLQSQSKTNTKGKPKAVRFASNALSVKAVWIDVDVGVSEPGKKPKYPDIPTALRAVLVFCRTVGLPQPSAIVYSGGGIHFYWISKTALTPSEWQPYASGLKNLLLANNILCDSGLTTDIVRLLRVPGTFNHKPEYGAPRPVTLAPQPLKLYDFEPQLGFIKQFAGPMTTEQVNKFELFVDGKRHPSFDAPPILKADPNDTLGAGVTHEEALLDARPIFKQCGFYRDALLNGGAGYDQALWMYSILGATFMENGNAIAHAISKGHEAYSANDTQALYDRKVADRADRGIGYPSCATIAGAGCEACKTCPLFAKGKSPLNIRPVVTATVTPAMGQTPGAKALKLPNGFDVNDAGIICKVVEKASKEGEISITMVPLFQCILSNFWEQKHPDCLNYIVTVDKGFTHMASVPHSTMSAMGFRAFLASPEVRTLINTAGANYLEEFYLSMLGKLREEMAAQEAVPFGWYEENGATRGFVFGGNVMEDTGLMRPCGIGDPNIKRYYTPTGTVQPWLDACKTLTDRKRPELTAIMLISFAAPLIYLAGKNSVMFSAYGDTGAGKSAAYKIGMSVWGHPLLTKGSEASTRNNVTTQMKEIRNLPFYWDEITTDKQRELVAVIMHELSDGVEKGRNVSGSRTQERGTFKLPLVQASNDSFREFLYDRNPNHPAGPVRCLEWFVAKIDGGPGHMNDADASTIINKLEGNYGQMGMRYAHYLAMNHERIAKEVQDMCNQVQKAFNAGNAERFWYTGVAIMQLAARYATEVGVPDISEAQIRDFMFTVMQEQIDTMKGQGMTGGKADSVEAILTGYLKDRGAEERVLFTNYTHLNQGKPPKPVVVLKQPSQQRNNAGGMEVRVAVENRLIIIGNRDFEIWAKANKHSPAKLRADLKKTYKAYLKDKVRIASGTIYQAPGREPVVVIPVTPAQSDLWDYLMSWASPEDRRAAEAEPEIEIVTGLTPVDDVVAMVHGATRQ